MAHYSLLGATAAISHSSIELPAPETREIGSVSLPDQVHAGLPDEYRRGVEHAFALGTLTPMRIVFAAHHRVDSALVAFYDTTKLLSALLALDEALDGTSEHDLIAIARDATVSQPFTK
jgi:hypothetical protein